MPGKKSNILRDYHVLVVRGPTGFEWQVRYNRHASPVQRSPASFSTQAEASAAGEIALAAIRRDAAGPAL